jgi:hypothetical protein
MQQMLYKLRGPLRLQCIITGQSFMHAALLLCTCAVLLGYLLL